LPGFVVVESL